MAQEEECPVAGVIYGSETIPVPEEKRLVMALVKDKGEKLVKKMVPFDSLEKPKTNMDAGYRQCLGDECGVWFPSSGAGERKCPCCKIRGGMRGSLIHTTYPAHLSHGGRKPAAP